MSCYCKWFGIRDIFRGKRVIVFNDFCFVFIICCGAGVEFVVYWENVGCYVFN